MIRVSNFFLTALSADKSSEKRKRDEFSVETLTDDSAGPWANVEAPKDPYQLALEAFKTNPIVPMSIAPVAPSKEPESEEAEGTSAKNPRLHIVEPEADDEVWEKKNERKMGFVLPPRPARGATIAEVAVSCLESLPRYPFLAQVHFSRSRRLGERLPGPSLECTSPRSSTRYRIVG